MPFRPQNIAEKKCQCLPRPRFLRPGNAIHGEKGSSSSNEVHNLSFGTSLLVNLIHSVPGSAWSFQYSFGRAARISIPLRISKVINITLMKCAKRSQKGKSEYSITIEDHIKRSISAKVCYAVLYL